MLSVAVPSLVARILEGAGRINVGQGALMTAQGIGAALSPLLGRFIAEELRLPTVFALLGALSIGWLVIWLSFAPLLRRASNPSDPNGARTS
jgi:hypothetical protein